MFKRSFKKRLSIFSWIAAFTIYSFWSGCQVIQSLSNYKAFKKTVQASSISNYPEENVHIPVKIIDGHIFVTIQINGESFRFLLDSGAPTTITKQLANELDLKKRGVVNMQGTGGHEISSDFLTIPKIKIQGVVFNQVGAVSVDVNKTNHAKIAKCLNADGILGSTMLGLANWKISMRNSEIILLGQEASLQKSKETMAMPLVMKGLNYPNIKATIGDTSLELTVDYGFNQFLTLPANVKSTQANNIIGEATGKGSLASGLRGMEDTMYNSFLLKNIKLGETKIDSVPADLTYNSNLLMGTKIFEEYNVSLLYLKDSIYFQPLKQKDLKRFSYGFRWTIDKYMTPRVRYIWNNSQLAKAGVDPGDRITSWKDECLGQLTFEKYCRLFKNDTLNKRKPLNIEIETSGCRTKSFSIKPYNLYK